MMYLSVDVTLKCNKLYLHIKTELDDRKGLFYHIQKYPFFSYRWWGKQFT